MDNYLEISMEKNIKVASSSSEEIYTVSFKFENDVVSINCNCKAGLVKMLCKHRLNLLGGDISGMIDKTEESTLIDILSKIKKSKIPELCSKLDNIELKFKKLDIERKNLRKEIGLKFSNGF